MPRASTRDPLPDAGRATIGDLLTWGRRRLHAARPPVAAREASLLLKSVLGVDEATLRAHPERTMSRAQAEAFVDRLRRRVAGEPAAYLTGVREFYGRRFDVDSRVLIPRPETELLVELALDLPLPVQPKILDLGTGSGCLAISLACELPGATLTAIDCSPAALACAAANARRHGVSERLHLACSDWTRALDLTSFDLTIVNPPYLSLDEWRRCAVEIRDHEPRRALEAGEDGLSEYRRLVTELSRLRAGSWIVFEIGASQAQSVVELCGPILEGRSVHVHRDLAGLDRAVVGTRSSAPESL